MQECDRVEVKTRGMEAFMMAKKKLIAITEGEKRGILIALEEEQKRSSGNRERLNLIANLARRTQEAPRHRFLWPCGKAPLYDLYLDSEEWAMAKHSVNELRNQRIADGRGTGSTDDSLYKLMTAKYRNAPER